MFAPAAFVLALHVVPAPPAAAQDPSAHCAQARARQREAWRTAGPPREQPGTTDGRKVRHYATDTLGTWIVEIVGRQSSAMTLVTTDRVTSVEWTASCTPSIEERARPRAGEPRFTDADLAARLGSGGRGVVYMWSPHMPLSIDAFSAVAAAAGVRGFAVQVLLDPAADRAFAARVAHERGLPSSALRVADSVELQFRDVLVHAPTVQAYAGGRLLGSPYPGGHTEAEYGAYLDRIVTTGGR